MKAYLMASALTVALFSGTAHAAPGIRYFGTDSGFPFSQAVEVEGVLYLSGQIGVRPGEAALVPGGIKAEARQAMDNIGAVLRMRGLGFDDVFKCTVMLADIQEWAAFNEVYRGYFKPGRLPARSAFGASGLALGGRLEIECWARASTGE